MIFKFNPRTDPYGCVRHRTYSRGAFLDAVSIEKAKDQNDLIRQPDITRRVTNVRFYKSRYSGAFDLMSTLRFNRPCADISVNLTESVDYYRG